MLRTEAKRKRYQTENGNGKPDNKLNINFM